LRSARGAPTQLPPASRRRFPTRVWGGSPAWRGPRRGPARHWPAGPNPPHPPPPGAAQRGLRPSSLRPRAPRRRCHPRGDALGPPLCAPAPLPGPRREGWACSAAGSPGAAGAEHMHSPGRAPAVQGRRAQAAAVADALASLGRTRAGMASLTAYGKAAAGAGQRDHPRKLWGSAALEGLEGRERAVARRVPRDRGTFGPRGGRLPVARGPGICRSQNALNCGGRGKLWDSRKISVASDHSEDRGMGVKSCSSGARRGVGRCAFCQRLSCP
jgi:hypothetical protein